MSMIDSFEKMLASGQDSALLRFTLGDAYLKEQRPAEAAEHLREAVRQDPQYSAAWKRLGRALAEAGDAAAAMQAYREGIEVAEARGDKQASKEMQVFLRRLERAG
ncbi:MAG: tetratricopeptide repeat protein [Acidihalobacter sp.]|jgi:predicted Zn-dependent protease